MSVGRIFAVPHVWGREDSIPGLGRQSRRTNRPRRATGSFRFVVAPCLAAPAAASAQNGWPTILATDEDFETTGPFPWDARPIRIAGQTIESAIGLPGSGTKLFRNATGGTTSFTAFGLGAHTHIRLKFDLAFLDIWDSIDSPRGPDIPFVAIDGTIYEWTVNNSSGSIFNIGPSTVISTGTDLSCNWAIPDTVVRYDFLIPHTGPFSGC
ncbi:hypothetical protein [Thermaurantiacus sp.]